jgi:hypothetical protein
MLVLQLWQIKKITDEAFYQLELALVKVEVLIDKMSRLWVFICHRCRAKIFYIKTQFRRLKGPKSNLAAYGYQTAEIVFQLKLPLFYLHTRGPSHTHFVVKIMLVIEEFTFTARSFFIFICHPNPFSFVWSGIESIFIRTYFFN